MKFSLLNEQKNMQEGTCMFKLLIFKKIHFNSFAFRLSY